MCRHLLMLFIFSTLFIPVFAAEHPDYIPEKWRSPFKLYVSAQEAHDMKQAKPDEVLLIDVRTRPELKYIGVADSMDASIPIRTIDPKFRWSDKSSTFRTLKNQDFVTAVETLLTERNTKKVDAIILLMCQSGSRVPIAAKALYKAGGFTHVYTVWDGFEGVKAKTGKDKGKRVVNGWKNADLPWSYDLDKAKMYLPAIKLN